MPSRVERVPVPSCPDCGERMERGYRLDHGHNRNYPEKWVEGEPMPSFWHGVKKAPTREIVVFRCKRCGLLRDYAV